MQTPGISFHPLFHYPLIIAILFRIQLKMKCIHLSYLNIQLIQVNHYYRIPRVDEFIRPAAFKCFTTNIHRHNLFIIIHRFNGNPPQF